MSKSLIAFVTPHKREYSAGEDCFKLIIFHLLTGEEVSECTETIYDLLKYFDNPPEFVKFSVKGAVFDIDCLGKYGHVDHEFCEKLAVKLKNLQIPYRFISNLHIKAMCKFIAAKIDPSIDKEVMQIDSKGKSYLEDQYFSIISLSRTDDGYVVTKIRQIPKKYDPKEFLLDTSNPTKIIFSKAVEFFSSTEGAALKTKLAKWNPILLQENAKTFLFDAIKEIVDHMYGLESSKKYFIIPECVDRFGITNVERNPCAEDILVSIRKNEYLPATKACSVTRFHKKFYVTSNDIIIQKPYEITTQGHRIKLTLSVDLNNYPTIIQEPVILHKVKNMLIKLNAEKTEKLPIIGFFDNASVICLWKERENCYKFLDSWNGIFGKDLFLDFLLPKPTLVSSSTEVTSLAGAVYDLIKIISMLPDDIKIDPNWKFNVISDDEEPILLGFNTFGKIKKAETPISLMARMLEEHVTAIWKEIGEKPSKLGFQLLDEFNNCASRKRVEGGLQKACEMINIECFFV